MYSKIVVPLDGSKLAEGILPFARSFARGLNIPVELLLVIGPDVVEAFTDPKQGRYVDSVEAGMKRDSEAYLKRLAGNFAEPSRVVCSVETGSAVEVIIEKGAADPGALITMATHGRSGLERWLLGSVADKVLHGAANPLLFVRPSDRRSAEGEATLKKIVVPLDGSELAESILPHVKLLAQAMGAEVVLLRVYSLLTVGYIADAGMYTPAVEQLLEDLKEEATKYLEAQANRLRRGGVKSVSYVVLEGDSAGVIIDYARKTPDNIIAMCTHGRSGVGRWVLGSVTDRVVRHGGDPVLVLRARRAA